MTSPAQATAAKTPVLVAAVVVEAQAVRRALVARAVRAVALVTVRSPALVEWTAVARAELRPSAEQAARLLVPVARSAAQAARMPAG